MLGFASLACGGGLGRATWVLTDSASALPLSLPAPTVALVDTFPPDAVPTSDGKTLGSLADLAEGVGIEAVVGKVVVVGNAIFAVAGVDGQRCP